MKKNTRTTASSQKKLSEFQQSMEFARTYKINEQPPNKVYDLTKNKSALIEETKDKCFYPQVFLDNARHCDPCPLLEHCACVLKRTSPEYGLSDGLQRAPRKSKSQTKKTIK